jgi:hypothetical protein
MTPLLIGLSCLAALFLGWAAGPFVIKKIQGTIKRIEDSAKRSEEKNKKDNKYYSILGLPMFNEQKASKKSDRNLYIATIIFFGSLILALATGNAIFWEICGATLALTLILGL